MAKTTRFFRLSLIALSIGIIFIPMSADARPRGKSAGNPKYASIIIDAQSGKVLQEQNADKSLAPASLTKMMTLFLTFEALESGRLHMNKYLTISTNAMRQPPSKLGVTTKSRLTVKQAIQALVTRSGNDVAMVMAENIGGNEKAFAQMMTKRAHSLGMKNTYFYNPSGLPHPAQKSTARDMAVLGRALMQYFPQHYHFFQTADFNYNGHNVRSHNNLLRRYNGMDGIKTGYTNASGFNIVTSAVKNNRRLIVAVFGGRTAVSRDNHAADLMNRGFAMLGRSQQTIQVADASMPPKRSEIVAATNRTEQQADDKDANMIVASSQSNTSSSRTTIASRASTTTSNRGGWSPDGGQVRTLQAPVSTAQGSVSQASYTPPVATTSSNNWGIQVGAFSSSQQSQQALNHTQQQLRQHMGQQAQGRAVIVPSVTRQGTLYRARIIGLNAKTATRACEVLTDCMAFTLR